MTTSARQEGGCRNAARRQEGVSQEGREDAAGRPTVSASQNLCPALAVLRGHEASCNRALAAQVALLPAKVGLSVLDLPSISARRRIVELEMHSNT
jgi:hypothetical protein